MEREREAYQQESNGLSHEMYPHLILGIDADHDSNGSESRSGLSLILS